MEESKRADTLQQIEELRRLTTLELRTRYRRVFGWKSPLNRESLFQRLAWKLQARAEGDLSERARLRALEIADDTDLRLRAPISIASKTPVKISPATVEPKPKRLLPVPGTILTRSFAKRKNRRRRA